MATIGQYIFIGVIIEMVFEGEWYVYWFDDNEMTTEYESHLRLLA